MGLRFTNVTFVTSVHSLGQLPAAEHPEIAFAGRSNVGKSSLINRLINRRGLVQVSARPGKTRSLNFFLVDEALYAVDLPGYGYAQVSQATREKWRALIEGYLTTRKTLRCVVLIVDLRHGPSPLDIELVNWLRHQGLPFLMVYTKSDKLAKGRQQAQARLLDRAFAGRPEDRVLFSARSGEGRDQLLARLEEMVNG